MKKLLWAILYIAVFVAGWCAGTISNVRENKIVITSQCTGWGVQKSSSAFFESRDGVVIRDEKVANENYTTTCKCMASDRTHEATLVAQTEFSSNNAQDLRNTCDAACTAWCAQALTEFKFAE